jgi:hypothetical protein
VHDFAAEALENISIDTHFHNLILNVLTNEQTCSKRNVYADYYIVGPKVSWTFMQVFVIIRG